MTSGAKPRSADRNPRPISPEVHRRFLDYLELRNYFPKPELPRLSADAFQTLDAEYADLCERQSAGALTASDLTRLLEVRRILFRD